MVFVPSAKQAEIFRWVKFGQGSAVVIAVAGSGKSTTMVQTLPHIDPRDPVLMLAFNASIAKELKEKVAALGLETGRNMNNVRCKTFHSLGFSAVCKRLNKSMDDMKVDESKVRKIARHNWDEDTFSLYGSFCTQLVGLAKGEGIRALDSAPDAPFFWYELIEHHDLFLESEEATIEEAVALARELLILSNKAAIQGSIDYDDMLYLPILWKLSFFRSRWVIVDEAQDTNPVRRYLAHLALRAPEGRYGGRLIAVGDPNQGIYGFCHPPGTLVMTPNGSTKIENIRVGDPVIIGTTSGDTAGWSGTKKVKEIHRYEHSGMLITITAGDRTVKMTPHHKVPVKIDGAPYCTYMMCRSGVYRVGYCQAYAKGDFMLAQRVRSEHADAAWLLGSHKSKLDAIAAENKLLKRVKGTTFWDKSPREMEKMESEESEAFKLLAEHGRMADFPLIDNKRKPRIARNGSFITEACNIMDGMRIAFYDDEQTDSRKRGRGRQNFEWTECEISYRHYSGPVYGITVPKYSSASDRANESWPLYFAGKGKILVHNTGASANAIDLIKSEFNCIELPLTVSYRCPKAVGRIAQQLVPYFEVHENAPEGEVIHGKFKEILPLLGSNDAVLCRNTKPLVALAYKLMAQKVACHVLGSEIGKGLVALIKKMEARSVDGLVIKLEAFRDREVEKFLASEEDSKAAAVSDRVACVMTFIENMGEGKRTLAKLLSNIEELFTDNGNVLTLCTAHRSKGREWGTVAILEPELMPAKARQEWQQAQEQNLIYVSVTRAQQRLIYIQTEKER